MPANTVVATTLPIFILSFLASGLTTLLPTVDVRRPAEVQVALLLAQMQAMGVNAIAASPALLDKFARFYLKHPDAFPQLRSQIRHIYSGGAPVFVDLMDQVTAALPQASFHAVYGATEAEPVATLDATAITQSDRQQMANGAGLLVGDPVPSLEVRVIPNRWGDAHGPYSPQQWSELTLSTGAGEIVVTGPHVLTTAGPGEDVTLTKIEVGDTIWHRTGDAGRWDDQGRLWLLGRCAAILQPNIQQPNSQDTDSQDTDSQDTGGPQTLYPFAIESAAHTFPAIKHAALIALDDRRSLAIELYAPQDAQWLATFKESLAWAQFDEIRVLDRMPVDKRHNAKIDYLSLKRLLGSH